MKTNWKHKQICGIYCIKNTVTDKVYIGKSIAIAKRIYSHIYEMNANMSNCSKLQNAWNKYGKSNFEYFIVEEIDRNRKDIESYIADREVYWMDIHNSIKNGYNLKRDSSTECIMSESTREKLRGRYGELNPNFGNSWSEEQKAHLSILKKDMHKKGLLKLASTEEYAKGALVKQLRWKQDPSLLKQMVDKCNLTKIKYEIHQFSGEGKTLIRVWKDILELSQHHPEYKRHNIYAVCSGEKHRMYGFVWKKILKETI